jgi:hypothetical protein
MKLSKDPREQKGKKRTKHTTAGIRWWSPTQLLICRSEAFTWLILRTVPFGLVGERRRPQDIEALTMLLVAKVVTPQYVMGTTSTRKRWVSY